MICSDLGLGRQSSSSNLPAKTAHCGWNDYPVVPYAKQFSAKVDIFDMSS